MLAAKDVGIGLLTSGTSITRYKIDGFYWMGSEWKKIIYSENIALSEILCST